MTGLRVRGAPSSLATLAARLRAEGFEVEELAGADEASTEERGANAAQGSADRPPGAALAVGSNDAASQATGLLGESPPMQELLRTLRRVAPVRTTILISGESGVGKERVARALHRLSPRAEGPWIAVNCGAIPENLLESELFGHRRGAFTDAVRDRRGLFEEASGGTLFLDEIGELPLDLQPKLLRVLQEQELRPLGASNDIKVDTRVLAATVRDLRAEVAAGRFREDLYYRLNVIQLVVPPLRQRLTDLPLLMEDILARVNERLGTRVLGTTAAVQALLSGYPWPGNVRELENCIESAVVLTDGPYITLRDLPERIRQSSLSADPGSAAIDRESRPGSAVIDRESRLGSAVVDRESAAATDHTSPPDPGHALSIKRASRDLEENLIRRALKHTGGNRTSAARLLEISHRTLLYKIKEFGIDREGRPGPAVADREGRPGPAVADRETS